MSSQVPCSVLRNGKFSKNDFWKKIQHPMSDELISLIMKVDPTWIFANSHDYKYSILVFCKVPLYYKTTSWFWFEKYAHHIHEK